MPIDSPRGDFEVFDHFGLGQNVDAPELWNVTANSGATADVVARHGGWVRLAAAGDGADAILVASERVFEADEGEPIVFETRLLITDVSVASGFFGFTDNEVEAGGVVIEDEGGTLNTVAADAMGFMFEGPQDETWQAMGVQNDVDNTQLALTLKDDAADSVIQTLRLEGYTRDSGTMLYYIDGKLVSTRTSWYRSQIVYCIGVSIDDRGTAFNCDIDYIYGKAPMGSAA